MRVHLQVSDEIVPLVDDVVACLKREHSVASDFGGRVGVPMPFASASPSGEGRATRTCFFGKPLYHSVPKFRTH